MLAGQRRAMRDNRVAGRARGHRHLEQRRHRRAARPRHPPAGRPGQHPLRVGPAADAERPEVRRPAAAERPRSRWSRYRRRASSSTSPPTTPRSARRCCASPAVYTAPPRRFNISLTEAYAIYRQSDALLISQVIAARVRRRAGRRRPGALRTRRRAGGRRRSSATSASRPTARSRRIRAVLTSLGALDGPKSVILVSEGLVLEGLGGELDDLATVAADVRASLDVLLLDVPLFDASQSQRPTTASDDRRLQEEGLEMLAGMARGHAPSGGDQRRVRVPPDRDGAVGLLPARRRAGAQRPRRQAAPHRGEDRAARRHRSSRGARSCRPTARAAATPIEALTAHAASRRRRPPRLPMRHVDVDLQGARHRRACGC